MSALRAQRPLVAAGSGALAAALLITGPAYLISDFWLSDFSVGMFEIVILGVVSLVSALLAATFTLSGPESTAPRGPLGLFVTSCPVSNVIALGAFAATIVVSWFVPAVGLLGIPVIAGALGALGVRGHLVRRTARSCPVSSSAGPPQASPN